MTEIYTEYGIQAPDGNVHWGSFLGRSLGTETERALMSLVLHKTAEELGWPVDEFMGRFRWVPRKVEYNGVRLPMDDPAVIPAPIPDTLPTPAPIEATGE